MDESPEIAELIEAYLDQMRSGTAPLPEAFAAAHPECAGELLRLLPLLSALEREAAGNEPDATVKIAPGDRVRGLPDLRDADFQLIREISHGGMGTVFEAVQLSLGRKVAVKILSPTLLTDAGQRASFENEARTIAMLHHPHIVKILSAGCSAERCFYAMELIPGKRLDQCSFTDPREIARIGLQAAAALAYAHGCNIMHRDIKPGNLLLDADRQLRVCDFGIAAILRESGELVEESTSRTGTLRYMAPERLARGVNTFAADQYALGATLYELVSGGPLWVGLARDELIRRICHGPLPPLRCAEPDLAAIINKSVSFRPGERYASMDEMAADLRRFLNREPVAAARPSVPHRVWLWAKRKPAVAVLTAALAVALTAAFLAAGLGFVKTRAALVRAERNAAAADAALTQVFRRMAELPPTPKSNALLASLLPYCRMIAAERNLPVRQLYSANAVIGELALRSGDLPLAERACREMAALQRGAYPLNQLAVVLTRQGRQAEARELFQQVAAQYAASEKPEERFEAVRALIALSDSPESGERTRAFGILEKLLAAHPQNPDYLFQYALLLDENPRLHRQLNLPGVEPNASALLRKLFDAHPDRPEYGLALVNRTLKKLELPHLGSGRRRWHDTDAAAELAARLLGRWPNDPTVVSAVTRLYQRYIALLLKDDDRMRASRVTERLLSILEVVFYNPDVPDQVREELFKLQFERLETLKREGRGGPAFNLVAKIKSELSFYQGSRRAEFQKWLENFSGDGIPAASGGATPGGERRTPRSRARFDGGRRTPSGARRDAADGGASRKTVKSIRPAERPQPTAAGPET